MQTFGIHKSPQGEFVDGPYGVFSSSNANISGEVEFNSGAIHRWTGTEWKKLDGLKSPDIGIFIAVLE